MGWFDGACCVRSLAGEFIEENGTGAVTKKSIFKSTSPLLIALALAAREQEPVML
jgi:hypothetical protein